MDHCITSSKALIVIVFLNDNPLKYAKVFKYSLTFGHSEPFSGTVIAY